MNSPNAWARCALPTLRPWVHGETVGWAKAEGRAHAGFCFGLPPFGPLRKRRVGGRAQRGARQDVEQASSGPRFLCGGPVDAPPQHGTPPGDRSRSERRGRRGVLSFGDFSLDKQRKVTRRRGAAEPVSARPKVARPSTPYRNKPGRSPNAWARCALPTLRWTAPRLCAEALSRRMMSLQLAGRVGKGRRPCPRGGRPAGHRVGTLRFAHPTLDRAAP